MRQRQSSALQLDSGLIRPAISTIRRRKVAEHGQVAALSARRSIAIHEFPVPDVDDESILLGIGLAGVCGSDLLRFTDVGATLDLPLPVVVGHELTCRVLRLCRRASAVMSVDDR